MSTYYQDYYDSNSYNYDYYDPPHDPPRGVRRGSDLVAAASGGGDCCPHVVDNGLFAATLAAFPIVTYLIYEQILMFIMMRRRKRTFQDVCESSVQCNVIFQGKYGFRACSGKIGH